MMGFYTNSETKYLRKYFLRAKESFIKLNKILKTRLPVIEHYDLSYHNNLSVAFDRLEEIIIKISKYKGNHQIPKSLLFRTRESIELICKDLDNVSSQRGRILREIRELEERETNLKKLLKVEKDTRKKIMRLLKKSNKTIHDIKLIQAKLNF